ncbi:MAG: peptidoglycan-binding protein [Tychonema bourrellyi B0820]|uniref:Peptidoglycan-binding protein n=1 Tax=Tychonema bourrellyi FEM_GT703 TaxID=2040638 RepID=A0A2G4F4L4_9CYAN|nr:peptidoglycan-binding protein [Tychonema bourrellyi]MDQ2100186.1 peptidoglycan-binding protein [Tychonema bourrellyi B0820]PHX56702.1 peptidoglycan-binding protein [Tychonema bourrellyi FEM_GT703]
MRITTATILGLVALVTPGLTRNATAAFESKSFVQEQSSQDLVTPADSGASASPEANSDRKMFNKPFYAGEQKPVRKEKTISAGADGPEVAAIQQRLQIHGFAIGKIDGSYGSRTTSAVNDFQQSKGLNSDGIVDKSTWTALAADPVPASKVSQNNAPIENEAAVPSKTVTILTKGSFGAKVKTLQARLEVAGYAPGPIDGIFGARTISAVKGFQESQGLKANGVVDEITWKAIGKN